MLKKNIIFITSIILLAVLITACGSKEESSGGTAAAESGETLTLRFAHFLPENTAPHQSVVHLKEELEERSEGRIELDIYSEGILGNEPDIFQQLQEGSIDGAFISSGELVNHSDDFAVWSMPFLMQNYDEGAEIAKSDEAIALYETLDSVKGLGHVFAGMRYIITTDEPYTELSDIQGLALRHLPSPVITSWYSELNVSSVPIPQPEVYTSYQTGVIDAVDTELDIIFAHSLYEIGNHITAIDQLLHGGILLNEELWESLSDEDKQIFEDSMEETLNFNIELNQGREEELLERATKEHNLEYHEIEDLDFMLEKAVEFHQKYADQSEVMKNFIDKSREITSFDF